MILRVLAGLALMALSAGAVRAEAGPAVGEVAQGAVSLHGRAVPLPPGEWTVVGRGYGRIAGESPGAYGTILGMVLAQAPAGLVEGLVLVATNALPVQEGWGPPAECGNAALLYATDIRVQNRSLSCGHARVMPAPGLALGQAPAWPAARAEMERRGWRLPSEIILAGVRVGDRRDVLDVRYGFKTPGPLAPDGRDAVADDVRNKLLHTLMQAWTDGTRGRVEAALTLSSAEIKPLDPPWNTAPEPGPGSKEMSVWELSLYKLTTNRIMQTGISFGIGMLLTASPYTSGVLALWQSITHAAVYYGNELAWEWPRTPGTMDFVAQEAGR